jgi:UDP-N-acetylmuramoylalanine--D-glutamate ligase
MFEVKDQDVLVVGLGSRGRAACELLRRQGANVVGIDNNDTPDLRRNSELLAAQGIEVALGISAPPKRNFSLAVLSPAIPPKSTLVTAVIEAGVPVVSELEFGFQQAKCLTIAVAGTNGKSTTARLVEKILAHNDRKSVICGHRARPICSVVEESRHLDFLIIQVNSFQLETTKQFRPSVAVLLNLAPDHLERFGEPEDYTRVYGRLFATQQAFDWALVQSEALARLRQLEISIPGKTITFSATDAAADLHLERGLVLSRFPNWAGALLDLEECKLRGPHNAENIMAALAVGHVLRLPLERMCEPLKSSGPGPHRFEVVGEINGVQFINDSKATNLDALQKALQAARPSASGGTGGANIWLIAGGKQKGLQYHDVGPLLSKRVKKAFLIGETSDDLRAAWSLFTPCVVSDSLIQAVSEAAKNAAAGDVVLLSPACSSLDQFRDYQDRGSVFCQAVKSIGSGALMGDPNRQDKMMTA